MNSKENLGTVFWEICCDASVGCSSRWTQQKFHNSPYVIWEIFWGMSRPIFTLSLINHTMCTTSQWLLKHGHWSWAWNFLYLLGLLDACCPPADLPGGLVEPALDVALPVLVEVRVRHHLVTFRRHLGGLGGCWDETRSHMLKPKVITPWSQPLVSKPSEDWGMSRLKLGKWRSKQMYWRDTLVIGHRWDIRRSQIRK